MRAKLVVLAFAISALVLALVATVALGGDRSKVGTTLVGYSEVPSVSSMGRGDFTATIDDQNRVIEYRLTLGGTFNAPLLFAHIHFAQRDVNGGVAAFLCGGGSKPAPCPANGTVTGTITPADVIGPAGQGIAAGEWDELVAAIRAGVTYANVHSSTQPGGEIRGQISDKGQRGDRGDREND
jgi:hypothetical protein